MIWSITQHTTYLGGPDSGKTTSHHIGEVDDTNLPPNSALLDLFGVGERNDVQVSSVQDGIIQAKIQYSPLNKNGWMRDRDTSFEYVVIFEAVRRP